MHMYIDGLVQDCSNSSALAVELLQSCTKPSIYVFIHSKEKKNNVIWTYTTILFSMYNSTL